MENLRTLCVPCHADVTKKQAAERAAARLYASGQRTLTEFLAPVGGAGVQKPRGRKRAAPVATPEEPADKPRRFFDAPVLHVLNLTSSQSPHEFHAQQRSAK